MYLKDKGVVKHHAVSVRDTSKPIRWFFQLYQLQECKYTNMICLDLNRGLSHMITAKQKARQEKAFSAGKH